VHGQLPRQRVNEFRRMAAHRNDPAVTEAVEAGASRAEVLRRIDTPRPAPLEDPEPARHVRGGRPPPTSNKSCLSAFRSRHDPKGIIEQIIRGAEEAPKIDDLINWDDIDQVDLDLVETWIERITVSVRSLNRLKKHLIWCLDDVDGGES